MRFFFPDSQDQVDPAFDFHAERSSEFKVRQRDDRYAHEVLRRPAYDGLLAGERLFHTTQAIVDRDTPSLR